MSTLNITFHYSDPNQVTSRVRLSCSVYQHDGNPWPNIPTNIVPVFQQTVDVTPGKASSFDLPINGLQLEKLWLAAMGTFVVGSPDNKGTFVAEPPNAQVPDELANQTPPWISLQVSATGSGISGTLRVVKGPEPVPNSPNVGNWQAVSTLDSVSPPKSPSSVHAGEAER